MALTCAYLPRQERRIRVLLVRRGRPGVAWRNGGDNQVAAGCIRIVNQQAAPPCYMRTQ